MGGNYLCGQSPTAAQEPSDTDLDSVDMDWFEEQVKADMTHNRPMDKLARPLKIIDTQVWPVLAGRVKAFEELKVKSAWAGNYDYCHWDENGIIGDSVITLFIL